MILAKFIIEMNKLKQCLLVMHIHSGKNKKVKRQPMLL